MVVSGEQQSRAGSRHWGCPPPAVLRPRASWPLSGAFCIACEELLMAVFGRMYLVAVPAMFSEQQPGGIWQKHPTRLWEASLKPWVRLGSVSLPALREERSVVARLLLSVGQFPGFAEEPGWEFGMGTCSTTRSWKCNPAQLSIILLRWNAPWTRVGACSKEAGGK